MNLHEKVENYFKTTKRKKRKHYFITLENFWEELDKEITNMQIPNDWKIDRKIWHFMNNTIETPKCDSCKLNNKKWQIYKHEYGYCSQSCACKESLIKTSKSLGVTNPFQLESIKEKSKKTLISKYGVDNISKLDSIKEQKIKTTMKNYNRPHNVGDNSVLMMKKYNVKSPAHLTDVFEKIQYNRFKIRHQLITPSGKIVNMQGFEAPVYNILISEGYKEEDIRYRKSEMPKIFYIHNGKKKRYYPDFFISKENLIIEVKSKYTYEIELEKNNLKEQASKNMGYNYRIVIHKI